MAQLDTQDAYKNEKLIKTLPECVRGGKLARSNLRGPLRLLENPSTRSPAIHQFQFQRIALTIACHKFQ
jgi:hypothetical protein